MGTSLNFTMDLIRLALGDGQTLEPDCSAGLSDGLGDRMVFSTEPGTMTVELLRFKPELGAAPGLEHALRASVDALGRLDPALATILAVDQVDELGGLALVSVHASGTRLSQVMPREGGLSLAGALVSELGPALARLHEAGHVHGALTPDRILVSHEGRLVVLEHVLGAALGELALPADGLRSTAGIAVPDGRGPVAIDPKLDVLQLGFIALALATGQRLSPSDYPHHVGMLLEHMSRSNPQGAGDFRTWLERALQVDGRPFADASEAIAAFGELPQDLFSARDQPRADASATAESSAAPELDVAVETGPTPLPADEDRPRQPGSLLTRVLPPTLLTRLQGARKIAAAIGAVVVLQSAILAYSMMTSSSTDGPAGASASPYRMQTQATSAPAVSGSSPDAGATPQELVKSQPVREPAQPPVHATPPPSGPAAAADSASDETSLPPAVPAESQPVAEANVIELPEPPPPVQPGAVEIVFPIELQVFEGETLLGSSSGPVSLAPGPHTIDLVNEELGFRSRQTVNVVSGEVLSVTIAVPNGRVDINALPWADVWVDGIAVGQTPLANVSLPIGRHDVVFRHPELGERRETVTVRASGIARVSAVFQR